MSHRNPAGIYLFKANSGKTKTICKTCSKLLKTSERRQWHGLDACLHCCLWRDFTHCPGISIVDVVQVNINREETFITFCKAFRIDVEKLTPAFPYISTLNEELWLRFLDIRRWWNLWSKRELWRCWFFSKRIWVRWFLFSGESIF